MIYQVLNRSGNPASYDDNINPDALFLKEEQAHEYIEFLRTECNLEGEDFKVIIFGEGL